MDIKDYLTLKYILPLVDLIMIIFILVLDASSRLYDLISLIFVSLLIAITIINGVRTSRRAKYYRLVIGIGIIIIGVIALFFEVLFFRAALTIIMGIILLSISIASFLEWRTSSSGYSTSTPVETPEPGPEPEPGPSPEPFQK